MQPAPLPDNEAERLQTLLNYRVMDTDPEPDFDSLTQMASDICQMPIALVSLVDDHRQWFKSHHGLDATETERDVAFCAHAILDDEIFEIHDSRADARFADNPLVTSAPHVIAYAGIPLRAPNGCNIGTLCVIDHVPRQLNEQQRAHLRILGQQVISQLELRKSMQEKAALIQEQQALLQSISVKNEELGQFAYRTSHDLRAPLIRMSQLAQLCLLDIDDGEFESVKSSCLLIQENSIRLNQLVTDIINLTRADLKVESVGRVVVADIVQNAMDMYSELAKEMSVIVDATIEEDLVVQTQGVRLQQIINNLISNAIKYSDQRKTHRYVQIEADLSDNQLVIRIVDNGIGIPADKQSELFDMFVRFHPEVSFGSGLGTSIVKRHVDALGGQIHLDSNEQGSCFTVELPIN